MESYPGRANSSQNVKRRGALHPFPTPRAPCIRFSSTPCIRDGEGEEEEEEGEEGGEQEGEEEEEEGEGSGGGGGRNSYCSVCELESAFEKESL